MFKIETGSEYSGHPRFSNRGNFVLLFGRASEEAVFEMKMFQLIENKEFNLIKEGEFNEILLKSRGLDWYYKE